MDVYCHILITLQWLTKLKTKSTKPSIFREQKNTHTKQCPTDIFGNRYFVHSSTLFRQ